MTTELYRISLAEHFSGDALGPLIKKRLFGGYEVPLWPFLSTVGYPVFLQGAVLGRARRGRLEVLAGVVVEEAVREIARNVPNFASNIESAPRQQWAYEYLRKVATDGMRHLAREPISLLDLWLGAFVPPEFDIRNQKEVMRTITKKIRLAVALDRDDAFLLVGISFGASYPELTEQLWRADFEEDVDQDQWARARKAGVDIPEQFTIFPLEQMEREVLSKFAVYISQNFPELVTPLA